MNNLNIDIDIINKAPRDTKIAVAMSGGVDSSTVAALLKERGYDVVGITMQLYDHGKMIEKKGACCAGSDIHDAKAVADKFNFPHYVLNYENLFREKVMEDFADSYLAGRTPIPCINCNNSVKFADLLKLAQNIGADALATGHYVQRKIAADGTPQLHKAVDANKDQSYFLFTTTKTQLEFLRFPLGGLTKEQTRQEAKRLGLDIADKPDSQDICFVPNGDYASVIAKMRPTAFKKGEIIDMNGKIIGEHNGIINYTIGQRRGLGISSAAPLFVVKIDAAKNQIIIGGEDDLQNRRFVIKELNWLADEKIFDDEIEATVKLRSAHKGEKAKISAEKNDKKNDRAIIEMINSSRAITPGQACVIYDDERLLGGGWIETVL